MEQATDIIDFVTLLKKEVSQDVIHTFAFTLKSFLDGYTQKDQVMTTVKEIFPKSLSSLFEKIVENAPIIYPPSYFIHGIRGRLIKHPPYPIYHSPQDDLLCHMSDSSQSTSGSQTDSSFEELKPLKKKKKGSKKRRPANVWSEEESRRLRYYVDYYGKKEWCLIALLLNKEFNTSKTPSQCSQHYHRVASPSIIKKEWTKEEDELLLNLANQLSRRWSKIAKFIKGRTDTQCRRRWERLTQPKQQRKRKRVVT